MILSGHQIYPSGKLCKLPFLLILTRQSEIKYPPQNFCPASGFEVSAARNLVPAYLLLTIAKPLSADEKAKVAESLPAGGSFGGTCWGQGHHINLNTG